MDDLDRWTRVLPLGTGAFGQVHLAWDTVAEQWVAVKRFTGQDELGLLRFVIESRIRVEHPHLVRTLAFRLVDDRAWLVTELARGGSVRQLMTRAGALPWGWVAEAVDQVLDALVALHATNVVHRDLKPANLLLRDSGTARPHLLVGDFGIATWRTVSMTGIGAAIGTPGYLAPEYLLDGVQPSATTDLFAVGVLAAELLAGRRLVHASNSSPDIPADWSTTLPLPDDVPATLASVLRRMADPDPRRRYVDCAQAREALLAAAPAEARGGLDAVNAPDLLATLPPGWTIDGPAGSRVPDPATAWITPEPATVAAAPVFTDPAAGGNGSPGSVAGPPNGPAAPPVTGPADDSAIEPAARAPSRSGGRTPKPPKRAKRRRLRQAVLLVVLVLLLGGAGTLWIAALTRTVPGSATAGQGAQPGAGDETDTPPPDWTPVKIEPCTRAELARERDGEDGATERCQRVADGDDAQYWVAEPPGGFPKSDPAGPFPGEECTAESDEAYTPVGDQVVCTGRTWRIVT